MKKQKPKGLYKMATRNDDLAHRQTERTLRTLERRIASVYNQASQEMQEKIEKYFQAFAKKDAEKLAQVEAREITKHQYQQWRLSQMARGERYKALRDALAERMTKANEVAVAYINDATPSIYSLNRNYAAYTIEKVGGNVGFDLVDEQTVKRLIAKRPSLMPYYPKKKAVKRGIDLAWGKKQILSQITSGILQGESIPQLAKRLQQELPRMNKASAVRTARTAVTSAQNGGRLASYEKADQMGIKVRKVWVATKDGDTRKSHQKLDGQTVDWDEPFHSILGDIEYPGDPSAKPANVYSCRCTMRTEVPKKYEAEPRKMRVRDPVTGKNVLVNEMTYSEWEKWVKNR